MSEWYRNWFGDDYLELYPHRNEEDAAQLVALIEGSVTVRERTVLDLACGPGRHAVPLSAAGARVVGIDLSETLIRISAAVDGLEPVRGDMRWLPFGSDSFDIVVNLFTSFGYFEDDEEHLAVLKEVSRVLKTGGDFVMDFLNARAAVANLVPNEKTNMGAEEVDVSRAVTGAGRYVEKTIMRIRDGATFKERVRLFTPDELTGLFAGAGMEVVRTFGDYAGGEFSDLSNRLIMLAVKK